MKPLLKLLDGDILNFTEDHYNSVGCDTCNYGSSYVQDFSIVTTQGTLRMDVKQMYAYAVSHEFLIMTILPNVNEIQKMTICEFFLIGSKKKFKD